MTINRSDCETETVHLSRSDWFGLIAIAASVVVLPLTATWYVRNEMDTRMSALELKDERQEVRIAVVERSTITTEQFIEFNNNLTTLATQIPELQKAVDRLRDGR